MDHHPTRSTRAYRARSLLDVPIVIGWRDDVTVVDDASAQRSPIEFFAGTTVMVTITAASGADGATLYWDGHTGLPDAIADQSIVEALIDRDRKRTCIERSRVARAADSSVIRWGDTGRSAWA